MKPESRETLQSLLARRMTRRGVVRAGTGLAALTVLGPASRVGSASLPGFEPVSPSRADTVVVPEGYASRVVLRWGDALFEGVEPLDATRVAAGSLLERGAAARQARWFGTNCDGIGLFEAGDGLVMCVNHEIPTPTLMFPGWLDALRNREIAGFVRANPEAVAVMKASVGLSVVELERGGEWRVRTSSRLNRRITADTPIAIHGPARGHALFGTGDAAATAYGTFNNCAAGTTPWGTYLTAEENTDHFFGNAANADFDRATARAHARFGARERDSLYRWEHADSRFDMAANPRESLKFGWIVELDPRDPSAPIKKRTALGRFKHEGATTVLASDGRAVVYMGDDQTFEYVYKFVSRDAFDPERPEASRELLDHGTLYVARLDADGRGEWLPLAWGEHPELTEANGFASQADVVLLCREAADRVGATPMDRPEDIAVSPLDGRVYIACTNNAERGARGRGRQANAANARAPNPHGHIIEITESGDAAATTFTWAPLILAGRPTSANLLLEPLDEAARAPLDPEATHFGGFADVDVLSAFANPDNLGFDDAGNLWIVTDGNQPGGYNNGCFVCPTTGEYRGAVRQFMSGPIGAEICGCEITADGRTLFLTVQHPGSPGTVEAPAGRWPDGGDAVPRASLIAIESTDGARLGS